MIYSIRLRLGLITTAFMAAACAHAQISLILDSNGTAMPSGTDIIWTENVNFQSPGSPSLSTLTYTIDDTTDTGMGTYTGTGGTLVVDLELDDVVIGGNGFSLDGFWRYDALSTGGYAGLTGGGTFSSTVLETGPAIGYSGTSLQGFLTPEPAPFVAMGLGVVGLLIRRRRKA